MAVFGVTHRMVVRCLNEFLAAAKPDADLFGYAVKGMNDNEIKDLPKEENEIRKLKPGKYQDRDLNLRLVVNDAGERRWTFCFFWMGYSANRQWVLKMHASSQSRPGGRW
jgi:hypothetical protein